MAGIDGKRIDEILGAAVADGKVPGAVALVVDRDGVVYEGAAGSTRVDGEGQAVTPTTMFRIASMTKALATVGVLQLVEQGKVGLDAPVADVLPEFGSLQVLDGFDGEKPRLRPPASQATVRQLLTHTSGLGYFFLNPDLKRHVETTGVGNPFSCDPSFLQAPMVHDPGTAWEYSSGVDWGGQIIEKIEGKPLDAYLAEHLFGPLGMKDATFRIDAARRARLMAVHARNAAGGLDVSPVDLPPEPAMACGGHGSYMTARDYGCFLRAMLRGGELDGKRVLKSETVDTAMSPNIGSIRLPEVLKSCEPMLANDVPSLPFAQTWGIGFHLTLEDVPGMRRAGTADWAGIFNLYYWIDRKSGVGATLMTQVLPFFDQGVIDTLLQFESTVYAS